jgi:putative ABC transport system permease protein
MYRASLRFLPRAFRARHGEEMVALFEALGSEARARAGFIGIAACLLGETADVLATAARLRLAHRGSSQARSPALASLGPSAHLHRRSNDMESLGQDIAYALRAIIRRPGFTAVAVITLGLGIGATTAIFSVVNSVVLRPLPYPDPGQITMVWRTIPSLNWTRGPMSHPNFLDFRTSATTFESMAAYGSTQPSTILVGSEPQLHFGMLVSASLFSVLGVLPAEGRPFTESEDAPGAPMVIILSHRLATLLSAGKGSMVGKSVSIDRVPHTVVGVMPERFGFPNQRPEYWLPLVPMGGENITDRNTNFLTVMGRLKRGVALGAARAEVEGIRTRLEREFPTDNADGTGVFLEARQQFVTGDVKPVLLVLFGAVGFVLAIACANLANLMLARGSGRRRELAVRMAIGASRARLIRQLLTESTLLALLGGMLGVAIAVLGTKLLVQFGPASLPRKAEIAVDGTTLAFTAVIALVSGLAAGLFPAFRFSRPDLQGDLKGSAQGTARITSHRVQRSLVVAQMALALVLLVGAGLLTNSLVRLMTVDPGFESKNLLTVRLALPADRYTEDGASTAFYDRVLERVRGLPGATSVAAAWSIPFSDYLASTGITIEGRDTPREERPLITMLPFRGDYFATMQMRLIEGRAVGDADRPDGPNVVVINEGMAKRFWPGESAIGKRFRRGDADDDPQWITVAGVVADVKEALDTVPGLQGYWPYARMAWARDMAIVVRTSGDPMLLATAVRSVVRSLDPEIPIVKMQTMQQLMSESVSDSRFRTMVVLSFSGVACLLALVGIYGVMAFLVAERTHEIGVRMALGAEQAGVLRHVLGQGLRLTTIGIAIGLVGAFAATRAIEAMLFGVEATDPVTYGLVVIALVTVAMLACWIPARRASRVDPLVALRGES